MNNNQTTYKNSPLCNIPIDWEVKESGEIDYFTIRNIKTKKTWLHHRHVHSGEEVTGLRYKCTK